MNAIPMLGSARLDRAGRDHERRRSRRHAVHRGRHVPVRHARLRRRADRPAAQAAHPAGHRHPHRVPPLPRQRPPAGPRGRRPAAPGADLAPPRPGGAARAGRGPHPDLGARQRRPAVPARPLRRLPPAALARAGAAGERAHRPGRPGRGVGAAPAAGRAPAAARPARLGRPARLRPHRDLRPRGAGPLAGPGDDLLGDRVPRPRAPRGRRARHRAEPRPLGLGQVAAARPERPAVRRRRPDADGVHLARRAGRRCCRPTSASGRGSAPRSGRPPRTSCSSIDGAELPPGNHVVPPDGVHGVTVLDLPARWDELEDPTRLRLQFEGDRAGRRRPLTRCRRCGSATR